ncbi:ANTH-domain-containing protein [Xylaria nigripes]|nr:ANTH-domain-containing protein [Xylaria nigripes]
MSSSFEKSVKGATKIKAAPPKTKYIEHILVATHSGEAGVGEVFRALQNRLRDSTWTVVFKSLITVHLMIREGSPDATLSYLARNRSQLAISNFTDAQIQGRNIRHYASYLAERVRAYKDVKIDWVRAKETRLESLSVEKGLLRETEIVQRQLIALLKCDVLDEPENEITITVFRLLVLDLLSLFQVLNQAMINILGHFFEMSKVDAERAMEIYRHFTKITDAVVRYLTVARQWEPHTRVEVPKVKHAPVNLGRQLEDYLHDPDFEINRRQYIAEQQAKKKGGISKGEKGSSEAKAESTNPFPAANTSSAPAAKAPQVTKGPDPDLIDFFDSIEQNQTVMATQSSAQPPQHGQIPMMNTGNPWSSGMQQPVQLQGTGFMPQTSGYPNNSPFQQPNPTGFPSQQMPTQLPPQMQPNFTGAGYGGYTQQSFTPTSLGTIPQDAVASFPIAPLSPPMQTGQQSTNPFRASMMANPTGMPANTGVTSSFPLPINPQAQPQSPPTRQATNPFARSSPQGMTPFTSPPSTSPFQSQPPSQSSASFQPAVTGTNPFAKNFASSGNQVQQEPQAGGNMLPQATGTTNPFRQGAFVNHQTGLGWQHNQMPIGGGLDQLSTQPIFPRPAQQTAWQQQQQ